MKRNIFLAAWLFVLVPMLVKAQERTVPMPNRHQMESAHVRVLLQDSEGYMWYGMKSDGVYRDDGYTLMPFRADFLHPDLLMNNNVTALCEDSLHRIWIGTKRGLYILDKHDYSIRSTGDQVLQIWTFDALKAAGGDSVLAYANRHLLVYDADGRCLSRTPAEKNPLVTQSRKELTDLRGNFWQIDDDGIPAVTLHPSVMLQEVAPDSLPLHCMIPPTLSGLPDWHRVHAVWKTADGTRWTGTSKGLWVVHPDSGEGECEQVGPDFGVVNTLSLGADGTIYMNTEWQGLVSYKDGLIARLDTTVRNASGLFLDKNDLWICTTSGRLLLYNVEKKTLNDLSAKCYLHGDIPLGIVVLKGDVWVLFNQRILIYSPAKQAVRYIYPSDLDPQPAFFRAIYTDGVGSIYLECEKNYYKVQMKQGTKQAAKERIALAAYQTIRGTYCPGMDTHFLRFAADERVVHLFFTTFNHLSKQHVRFAFRCDGDSEWQYLDAGQNDVRITRLSKGRHTLEVKATDANGQWGKDVFTVTIQCEPYWWETVWAYIAYVLLAVLLLSFSFWLGRKMKLS